MVRKANQLKKNITRKKPVKRSSKTRKKGNSFGKIRKAFEDERLWKITGLFLIVFSFALLVSFISYFYTFFADYVISNNQPAANWLGMFGRWLSKVFVENGFGISSFFFALLFFIYGFKLLFGKSLLNIGKTTSISLFLLFWLSASFGFLLGQHNDLYILGGG
ncbi:MAG: DNA translocase FtsK 4TM domain-containing protein, partial [Bacteroidales bacterium]|nr:DNA translocase FtsK 4TM domain-containing protein [Bacteroidales bacterium]